MWQVAETDEYERRHKRYRKKHPRELAAVLDNLDTYFRSLAAGVCPKQVKHGFMHNELHGVIAIDQKGGGVNLAQTRLYIYPERDTLYLITMGDKQSQQDDLAICREFVSAIRNESR